MKTGGGPSQRYKLPTAGIYQQNHPQGFLCYGARQIHKSNMNQCNSNEHSN